ncbi:MAG TPA: LacI family DNA-binding transcriptional regulator [Chthoniobacteraceae bacterium]|nr:LacI family DNA-binding transcriptional regulator [Chthoniobacteraceae bacterium]
MSRISQKELARRLGVSQATVSGVLNNHPSIRVAEKTRERILAAIRETDYQPNRIANAVFNRTSRTVGVIYQGGFVQLGVKKLAAVVKELVASEYLPLVYELLPYMEGSSQCQLLCDMKVQGVIVINASYPFMYDTYPRFLKGKVNVVAVDSPWEPHLHQVHSDRLQGFGILTEHLIAKGHRKIAVLASRVPSQGGDSPYTQSFGILHGVRKALGEAGLSPEGVEIFDSTGKGAPNWGDPYLPGMITMGRLLDKGCRPDAVIASSDSWAIGAMRECARRGLRVPEDLAIVGFNDDVQAEYAASPLTTVAPPVEEMARIAVAKVSEPFSEKEEGSHVTLLPCRLVVRESCGRPNASSLKEV